MTHRCVALRNGCFDQRRRDDATLDFAAHDLLDDFAELHRVEEKQNEDVQHAHVRTALRRLHPLTTNKVHVHVVYIKMVTRC